MSETIPASNLDSLRSSRPISFDVKNSKQIRQTFDELSYAKGACIIRMMNNFLGDETFKTGIISFLQKHTYGNAARGDLWAALTEEGHRTGTLDKSMEIIDIMETWTTQPGFPVVTANYDHSNKKLVLSQNRFVLAGQTDDTSSWWIPISIVTDAKPDFTNTTPTVWMKKEPTISLNISVQNWYLLNVGKTGE